MSIIDTLAYSVRTAGVFTRRLATSIALFNAIVIVSRLSNMFQAPIIGHFPDSVAHGEYGIQDVLMALRVDLGFVILGVLIGAFLTPSLIAVFQRGIVVMGEKGTLPLTVLHGMKNLTHLPKYWRTPKISSIPRYFNNKNIPRSILLWNVLITCFYSIGVMSTALAASSNHDLAATIMTLSGIVNGISTMLLFILVDPPASLIIDDCINGKRPNSDAVALNFHLISSRLLGCILGIFMLPIMASYVEYAAIWVDKIF